MSERSLIWQNRLLIGQGVSRIASRGGSPGCWPVGLVSHRGAAVSASGPTVFYRAAQSDAVEGPRLRARQQGQYRSRQIYQAALDFQFELS